MRTVLALIVIGLCALPGVYAGLPRLAPAAFEGQIGGVPVSAVFMSLLMAAFIVLAALCAAAARGPR